MKKKKESKVPKLLEMLENAVDEFQKSDNYLSYLKMQATLPEYSARNVMLILQQMPEATFVRGYKSWKELGRQVKKGENALYIIAPLKVKLDSDDDEKPSYLRFRAVPVFDVSQTEGEPVLIQPIPLEGEAPVSLLDAVSLLEETTGFDIEFDDISEFGVCCYIDKEIRIRNDISDAHKFKTMIHEAAHALMHSQLVYDPTLEDLSKMQRELEAESVAFVVSEYFGLDAKEYSPKYISAYTDKKAFFASQGRIQQTAKLLIEKINPLAAVPAAAGI